MFDNCKMAEQHNKISVDLFERTVRQAELVEKLAHEVRKGGGDVLRLEQEMERLAFYQTTAKGDPRGRARAAIEIARSSVLGRAVMQRLTPIK